MAEDFRSEDKTAVEVGKAAFEERFERMRPGFKMAIKAQNGFLAGLVFAEAKKARDGGDFTLAQELLGELEDLIQQAQKREAEKLKKAEKQFKADYKILERKARFEGGQTFYSVRGYLRAALKLAGQSNFIKANQELDQVKVILNKSVPQSGEQTVSSKSKPFTISGMPDFNESSPPSE
jgi:hypothetical protein